MCWQPWGSTCLAAYTATHQPCQVSMPAAMLPCATHLQVYPLPFIDRISEEPHDQEWDAVWLENEHVRLMVLPQLGGRIHVLEVRANADGKIND